MEYDLYRHVLWWIKKKNISLAVVIKIFAVQLEQDFSITAGGSVAFDFWFWRPALHSIDSNQETDFSSGVVTRNSVQDMFANITSWFYVTGLLCHRRSDFDMVIYWVSKSWILAPRDHRYCFVGWIRFKMWVSSWNWVLACVCWVLPSSLLSWPA